MTFPLESRTIEKMCIPSHLSSQMEQDLKESQDTTHGSTIESTLLLLQLTKSLVLCIFIEYL
jgi:hypothetical protein